MSSDPQRQQQLAEVLASLSPEQLLALAQQKQQGSTPQPVNIPATIDYSNILQEKHGGEPLGTTEELISQYATSPVGKVQPQVTVPSDRGRPRQINYYPNKVPQEPKPEDGMGTSGVSLDDVMAEIQRRYVDHEHEDLAEISDLVKNIVEPNMHLSPIDEDLAEPLDYCLNEREQTVMTVEVVFLQQLLRSISRLQESVDNLAGFIGSRYRGTVETNANPTTKPHPQLIVKDKTDDTQEDENDDHPTTEVTITGGRGKTKKTKGDAKKSRRPKRTRKSR